MSTEISPGGWEFIAREASDMVKELESEVERLRAVVEELLALNKRHGEPLGNLGGPIARARAALEGEDVK